MAIFGAKFTLQHKGMRLYVLVSIFGICLFLLGMFGFGLLKTQAFIGVICFVIVFAITRSGILDDILKKKTSYFD